MVEIPRYKVKKNSPKKESPKKNSLERVDKFMTYMTYEKKFIDKN
jgi:hypothetical protein